MVYFFNRCFLLLFLQRGGLLDQLHFFLQQYIDSRVFLQNNQSSQDSKASRSGPSQKLAVSLSTSSTEATGSSPKLEEPAEIQKEAPSRTSPIDLSTKKSSEPNSSQAATASGPVKGSHGTHARSVFC